LLALSSRKSYAYDVSDEEWAFVAPYLTLLTPEARQRLYPLREVFNGLRYAVRTGCRWRARPHDLPPWDIVYYQRQRWIKAGVFERLVGDRRAVLRLQAGRNTQPTATIFDSRTLPSTPESGARAGDDGAKKKKGSQVHIAVATRGHWLALHVTPANEQDRAPVSERAAPVQQVTGDNVERAYVEQGDTGEAPAQAAAQHGIQVEVVKRSEAKKGFVRLPKRWVVERSFGWASRFRRLVRDYERLPQTVAGLHFVVFAYLFLQRFVAALTPS
jgi:transposase